MVTINLNDNQFKRLLEESYLFREIITETFKEMTREPDLDFWRNLIRKTFPNRDNKIAEIKWIRNQTEGNLNTLALFEKNGFPYDKERLILGLASSKKFIESL
jgi:hypothetical protein